MRGQVERERRASVYSCVCERSKPACAGKLVDRTAL